MLSADNNIRSSDSEFCGSIFSDNNVVVTGVLECLSGCLGSRFGDIGFEVSIEDEIGLVEGEMDR